VERPPGAPSGATALRAVTCIGSFILAVARLRYRGLRRRRGRGRRLVCRHGRIRRECSFGERRQAVRVCDRAIQNPQPVVGQRHVPQRPAKDLLEHQGRARAAGTPRAARQYRPAGTDGRHGRNRTAGTQRQHRRYRSTRGERRYRRTRTEGRYRSPGTTRDRGGTGTNRAPRSNQGHRGPLGHRDRQGRPGPKDRPGLPAAWRVRTSTPTARQSRPWLPTATSRLTR